MAATFTRTTGLQLARQAREQFISGIEGTMVEIAAAVQGRLVALMDQGSSGREMQERRDALLAFEKARAAWVDGTLKAWRQALVAPTATARVRMAFGSFELIGDEVVENKILSSRLALAVEDKVKDLSDLRLRIQLLEGSQELARHDVLRPEVVPQLLVEQWTAAGLSREAWALVQDVIQQHLVDRLVEAYRRANEFLISRGVMPEIDLKPLVKRTASGAPGAARRGPDSGPDGAGKKKMQTKKKNERLGSLTSNNLRKRRKI